jgi:outer membrane protein TolC
MYQPLAPAVFLNLLRYRRFRRKWLEQLNQVRPIAHAQQYFTHLIFSQNILHLAANRHCHRDVHGPRESPRTGGRQPATGSDALSVRLAHNNLRPDLELGGFYQPTGLGGNQYSTAVPPVLLSTGGIGESLSQMFGLKYPTYGLTLNLRLPIKNHGAEADLADALVTQRGDQYRQARTAQTVNLDVTNAVHLLEQSKLTLEAAKVARDLAQKSLQAEERKYQLGNNTVFFVLDAQTQLAQAELALVQAQTGYQTAVAGIDHATGKLLDRHQIKLVPPHN